MPEPWQLCASRNVFLLGHGKDGMRFYFDMRDGEDFARDDIGVDLHNARAARLQATIALTEMARDYLGVPVIFATSCGGRADVMAGSTILDKP